MEIRATTRGRVTIPFTIRQKLGIKAGSKLQVKMKEAEYQIILKPITRERNRSLRGKPQGKTSTK